MLGDWFACDFELSFARQTPLAQLITDMHYVISAWWWIMGVIWKFSREGTTASPPKVTIFGADPKKNENWRGIWTNTNRKSKFLRAGAKVVFFPPKNPHLLALVGVTQLPQIFYGAVTARHQTILLLCYTNKLFIGATNDQYQMTFVSLSHIVCAISAGTDATGTAGSLWHFGAEVSH